MKAKLDIRVFAIEQAVKIMGVGVSQKDVVAKAQEIEKYVIGEAILPEVVDEASPVDYLDRIASLIGGNAGVATTVETVTK